MNWLRTGITEMVVTDLSQSQDLEVVSTDRLYAALASLRKADDQAFSPEIVSQVAAKTGVDHVIVGSYMKSGDNVRVNVRLQDVKTGRIVTSESAQGPSQSDLFQMVDDLSRRIRTKFAELRPGAAPGALVAQPGTPTAASAGLDRGLGDVTTNSIEAYKEYAEGINLHERGREPEAATRFEKAIALDPSFAMAYVKLAVVHNNLGRADLSNKYSAIALQHADRLTPRERYYIEGYYYSKSGETLARALDAYKKCVDLDPGHQACRHNLALQLMFLERFQEAAGHYEELTRRGATNPSTYDNLANAYVALGQSPKAAELMEQFVKRNPESAAGHGILGFALMSVGRYEDALKAFSQSELLDPASPQPTVGRAYAEAHLENWSAARAAATSLEASSDEFHRFFGGIAATLVESYGGRCPEMIAASDRAVAAFKTPSINTAAMRGDSADVLLACATSGTRRSRHSRKPWSKGKAGHSRRPSTPRWLSRWRPPAALRPPTMRSRRSRRW